MSEPPGRIDTALTPVGTDIWLAEGDIRPMDTRVVAEILFGTVMTALTECYLHGDGSREEQYIHETIRCLELATGASQRPRRSTRRPPE